MPKFISFKAGKYVKRLSKENYSIDAFKKKCKEEDIDISWKPLFAYSKMFLSKDAKLSKK